MKTLLKIKGKHQGQIGLSNPFHSEFLDNRVDNSDLGPKREIN